MLHFNIIDALILSYLVSLNKKIFVMIQVRVRLSNHSDIPDWPHISRYHPPLSPLSFILTPQSLVTAGGPGPIVTLRFMYKTYLCMCQEKFRCILFHRYTCRIRGYSDTPAWPHYTGYRWHTRQCLRHTWSPPIRSYTDTHEHCYILRLRARSYKASYILVRNDVHHTL